MIDLHTHTAFSDGSQTPTQLVEEAAAKGLTAIAVTDHDTVDGLPEAIAAGERLGVEIVPGVEINLEHDRVTMDMLGYFLAGQPSAELQEELRSSACTATSATRAWSSGWPSSGFPLDPRIWRPRPRTAPSGGRTRRGDGPRVRELDQRSLDCTSAAAPPRGWTAAVSPWAAPSSCCARRAPSPSSRIPASSAPTPPA